MRHIRADALDSRPNPRGGPEGRAPAGDRGGAKPHAAVPESVPNPKTETAAR